MYIHFALTRTQKAYYLTLKTATDFIYKLQGLENITKNTFFVILEVKH